jgi:uncharacterized protein (TIGR02246 family)
MRLIISRSFGALLLGLTVLVDAPAPAFTEDKGVAAIIVARLTDWAEAFNARDISRTCDLFSVDLISTMRGRPDEGREAVCGRIAKALAGRRSSIRYTLKVREIIVRDDIALVRLVWQVKTGIGAINRVSYEPGIDIFRREADGNWRIIRFLAFSVATR